VIRKVTLSCEEKNSTLGAELPKDPEVWSKISAQLMETAGLDAAEFFASPELYRGKSAEKAVTIADKYAKLMIELKESL
jgi:hypothetical protein